MESGCVAAFFYRTSSKSLSRYLLAAFFWYARQGALKKEPQEDCGSKSY
jgi:hypothetical protein